MGLGPSAAVAASHIVMVLILAAAIIRLMRLRARPRQVAPGWVLPVAVSYAFGAFLVERLYYVAARLLQPSGIDLWSAHPTPALLAGLVAASCYWVMPRIFEAQGMGVRARRKQCIAELSAMGVVWIILERALS